MRVLVVGGGGREHALCWRLSRDPSVDRVLVAPGNAGTASVAESIPVAADDVDGISGAAEHEAVDLVVVGPEAPLVAGLADRLEERGIPVFGPTAGAARLEGSKVWARDLCHRYGIPAPRSASFDDVEAARSHLAGVDPPFVIKADGIAGGKGVVVTHDRAEALRALDAALVQGIFGQAGRRVLIEEHLEGRELSCMAVTDGRDVVALAPARDHKRALDGDRGPNTGGMGAFSPVPGVDPDTERLILETVLRPTVRALQAEGVRYRGVVYAGLMMTADGPKVLEFNCRFGDPEAQVVLPLLSGDAAELLLACASEEGPAGRSATRTEQACVGVVLASGGYPGAYGTGVPISGLDEAATVDGVEVFHAGTVRREGRVLTAGGRVLTVSALGDGIEEARARAYQAASLIHFDGMELRRDIGLHTAAMER